MKKNNNIKKEKNRLNLLVKNQKKVRKMKERPAKFQRDLARVLNQKAKLL